MKLSIILITGLLCSLANRVLTKNGNYKALQSFGISNKIADLVTEAFNSGIKKNQNKNRQDAVTIGDNDQSSLIRDDNNIFTNGFLKLLGFDGRKIGAAALNGIIVIAQMLGNLLTDGQILKDEKKEKNEEIPKGDIFEWMMEITPAGVLEETKDKNLPDLLISILKEDKLKNKRKDCILLLLCKIKPFIWSMQDVIAGKQETEINEATDRISILFQHIPSMEEFKNNGEKCETNYTECSLF